MPVRSRNERRDRHLERIIVSDLHLGANADNAARAEAFGAFVRTLAGRTRELPRLVILGDLFDLPSHVTSGTDRAAAVDAWAERSLIELERILELHPGVAAALDEFRRRGGRLALMTGNHDLALAQPRLRAALEARIGPYDLHRWILYEPGVLYAEHGQQHHDLNVVRSLLDPDPRWDATGAPPAWAIEALAASHGLRDRLAAVSRLVAGSLATQARPGGLARKRDDYRRRHLPAAAASIGLPEVTLARIDALSEPSPRRTAWRLARRALGRGGGAGSLAGYLGDAARAVDAALAAEGLAVPLYVFGHSHGPTVEPLHGAGTGPRFANAGAWASVRPARLRELLGPGRYPFLRIVDGDGSAPDASLMLWDAATGTEQPYGAA